jgi:xanthine dehydrogenase/oxidase
MKDGLHPIQQRLAEAHGSQCGFCTPGIVMALYAQLRANPNATPHELEESMDGNLCRCTGYRPIIDAVRSLSNNKGGLEAPSGQAEAVPNPAAGGGGCCQGSGGSCPCKETLPKGVQTASSEEKVNGADSLEMEMRSKGRSEPIFPPALMQYASRSLKVTRDGFSWYQPTTLPELLALKNQFPQARLVAGNTEVGIETKFKNMKYTEIVCPSHVPELLVTSVEKNVGVTIGASVTVNGLRAFINSLTDRVTEIEGAGWTGMLRGLNAINDQITWFASNQIRNVAAIGGNIVTASPIGDLNPMLISQQAVATLVSTTGSRQVPLSEFFLGYRKVDLQPTEILQSVFVPFTQELEFCVPLKQARRREDDISIVTGCVRVKLTPDTAQGCWVVEDFGYALGGMAPTPISAKAVNAAAKGKKWDFKLLSDHLYDAIKEELSLPAGVPGGQSEYRTTLVASFLFRSFLAITGELTACIDAKPSGALPPAPTVEGSELSGAEGFVTKEKPSSRGQQNYYVSEGAIQTAQEKDGLHSEPAGEQKQSRPPVGQPVMHKSALMQVTGEAMYTNDTALPRNALHAMLVMSTKPHAKLLGVDISEAEKCEGFHSYLDHKSVTGHNQIGAVFKDEEVFAVDTVRYVGMVIGVILADTHDNAVAASKAVKVSYEDLPAAVSIEEAIAAKSFYPEVHEIRTGDVEAAANNADFVVEGTSSVGQQEHFYLETNATVALPTEHGHLEIIASTQNLSKTQAEVAAVTGLPMGQVVCKAKRLGGGFGGKEERSIFITVTAALAAHLTGRAVSILIERDVDMSITGQRHSFQFDYKAGCNKDGKLVFLDAMLYSNAGWSLDLSQAVMDRALFHSDNCYHWPAQRVRGTLCKTNQPSHTAFRGFGGPQGMMLTEFVMKHLAAKSGIHIDELRTRNWYKDGIRTHFGQVMEGFHVPRIFDSMQDNCDIAQRKKNIEAFNAVNKWKKRGLCQLPTKFGINFTAKFLNQGGALVHVYVFSYTFVLPFFSCL